MQFQELVSRKLSVSNLAFGASPLGNVFGEVSDTQAQRAVDTAIDLGINFFDVAPFYGATLAESRLGKCLAGKRQNIILATKVGRYGRFLPDGFDFSARRVTSSAEESMRRLRTDYIDLLHAHDIEFGDKKQIIEETLPAMRRLQEQGKVRLIGITGYPINLLVDVAHKTQPDFVLSYCHGTLLNQDITTRLLPSIQKAGTGLINASPLHMGLLTYQGPPDWHPASYEVKRKCRETAEWCAQQGIDLAEIALQFALQLPGVVTTLVGLADPETVRKNVAAANTPPDPEILQSIQQRLETIAPVVWHSPNKN